jgi:hypothetical protein
MADPAHTPPPTPFDADAADAADSPSAVLGAAPGAQIAYVGQALTRDEFSSYVDTLTFDNPPLWMVLHHTAIPAASWAPSGDPRRFWDAGEVGLSVARIKAKRLAQLRDIFDFYQREYGWSAGPQLWTDDRWIYVGTPLTQEGIHAAGGNYALIGGRRRYSLGLEVIGHYERQPWPEPVMANAAHAVATLQRKLGTFQLLSGKGPGFVSEHRMYSKPACPGAAVRSPSYLPRFMHALAAITPPTGRYRTLQVVHVLEAPQVGAPVAWGGTATLPAGQEIDLRPSGTAGWLHWSPAGFIPAHTVAPVDQLTLGLHADSPIMGGRIAPDDQVIAAFARICARKGSSYATEPARPIETVIGPRYAELCTATGVRLIVALAQCAHETGWLTAALAQRKDKDGRDLRNPAGIGVSEAKDKATPYHRVGTVFDADVGGYRPCTQFRDWRTESIPAHVGRLLAYATRKGERTPAQQEAVDTALAFRGLPSGCQGSAPTLRQLGSGPNPIPGCGWAGAGDAGGLDYGAKVAAAANAILAEVGR